MPRIRKKQVLPESTKDETDPNQPSTSESAPVKKKYNVCIWADEDGHICNASASYSLPDKKARIFCKDHANKTDLKIVFNSSKKLCEDCEKKIPTYGITKGKAMYCAPCAKIRIKNEEKLTNVVHTMCEICQKVQPTYGTEPKNPILCAACAKKHPEKDKFFNVKHIKCQDCHKTRPIYGIEPGKPLVCKNCAEKKPNKEDFKDVVNKMCEICKNTRPIYGTEKKKPLYCAPCADKQPNKDDLWNVVDKMCDDCKTVHPTYGTVQGKPFLCAGCAKKHTEIKDLRNVFDKMCLDCGVVQPSYGTEKGRPQFCAPCAAKHPPEENLTDVVNARCLTPYCGKQTNRKHLKGYCYRCFVHTFPDSPILRNHKTKERAVADFVRETFPNYTVALDQRIEGACSRRRPDILIDMAEYILIIEIDENQHQAYDCSCENRRLMEIFEDAGRRPVVMVRFNPDQYYDPKKKSVPSCWGSTENRGLCVVKDNKKTEWAQRLKTLKTTIEMVVSQGAIKEIDVIHLYYDGFSK